MGSTMDEAEVRAHLLRRALTRRQVLKRGLALGLSVPTLGALLSACGSDDDDDDGATETPSGNSGSNGEETSGDVDDAVQAVFDEFVSQELPGVSIELLQAAADEGSVTYYHTAAAPWPPLAEEFQRIFGSIISMDAVQLNTGPMVERFRSESASDTHIADVLNLSDLAAANDFIDNGWVLEYQISETDQYPAAVKNEGFWYPAAANPIAAAWNTTKVTPEDAAVLETWEGLKAADVWSKYTVGFVDPAIGGFTSIPLFLLDQEYGTDWWHELAEYPNRLYESINPASDALAAGEIDVLFYGSSSSFIQRWQNGAPLNWTYPTPAIDIPYAQFISGNAPHPNAGKILEEFAFSKYAQQWLNEQGHIVSYRPDVPNEADYTAEEWYKDPEGDPLPIDIEAYGERLESLIQEWHDVFEAS